MEYRCPFSDNLSERPAIITPEQTYTYRQIDQMIDQMNLPQKACVPFVAHPTLDTILTLFGLLRKESIACPISFRTPPSQLPNVFEQFKSFRPPRNIAAMLFTSGSSGTPKIACLTHENLFTSAANFPCHLDTNSRWLLSLPLFHVGGISILFRCFLKGAAVVLGHDLTHPILTHISAVPTHLHRLSHPLPNLKCLLLGGAPIPPSLIEKAHHLDLPLFTTYGMTEMSSAITLAENPQESHVGTLLPHRELNIARDGEIWVKGKTLFAGYWNGETIEGPSEWFPTKDLGKWNNNYLQIIGRKDRLFISGGENIQPEEIEFALCQIPGVISATVIPIDDPEFGKRPVAFLQTSHPHTLESIRAALDLPSFKHPVQIHPYSPSLGLKPNINDLKAAFRR